MLGVEYARIAKSGLLELSLVDDAAKWPAAATPVPTYWVPHASDEMPVVRENMRKRHRTPTLDLIGAWQKGETPNGTGAATIAAWCEAKGLQGAVWLATPPREPAIDQAAALELLRNLHPTDQRYQQTYVVRTPPQTQTPLRRYFRDAFGWLDDKLPAEIFAE